ncbi:hypothetical protein K491DRAFT_276016 [Lophiostoma macrostomum CBS 122681]|uniref:Uncharacterized protein n=1 Tax=Lophiostoma macrostomum CBS 122681 TaxID=1314788 RepID=A0A6A6TFU6_9PLEO|nr:hypothetical protein K491DRAFT_276016 [Lophiostoma macrostomum CBS 122681]
MSQAVNMGLHRDRRVSESRPRHTSGGRLQGGRIAPADEHEFPGLGYARCRVGLPEELAEKIVHYGRSNTASTVAPEQRTLRSDLLFCWRPLKAPGAIESSQLWRPDRDGDMMGSWPDQGVSPAPNTHSFVREAHRMFLSTFAQLNASSHFMPPSSITPHSLLLSCP